MLRLLQILGASVSLIYRKKNLYLKSLLIKKVVENIAETRFIFLINRKDELVLLIRCVFSFRSLGVYLMRRSAWAMTLAVSIIASYEISNFFLETDM